MRAACSGPPPGRGRASAPAPGRERLYREATLPAHVGEQPGGSAISCARYADDTRDWRKLSSEEIAKHFAKLQEGVQKAVASRERGSSEVIQCEAGRQLEGLATAIAVGTLQACSEGAYWAPDFADPASATIGDIRLPLSTLHVAAGGVDSAAVPPPRVGAAIASKAAAEEAQGGGGGGDKGHEGPLATIVTSADVGPLETAGRLAVEDDFPRVLLVRFTPAGQHARDLQPMLGDYRGTQLFYRSTYLRALLDMQRQIHADPVKQVEEGALIYTTDVTVLRGPAELGAEWLLNPPRFDVVWAALQRHPRCDDQGQYARFEEKAAVAETVDRIFALAASKGVDALVLPPLGLGGGLGHPAADAGDLLRTAALSQGRDGQGRRVVPRVFVCQEYPGQLHGSWAPFAAAAERGREPPVHRELVPVRASPWLRPGWPPPPRERLRAPLRGARGRSSSRACSAAVLGSAGRAIAC